MGISRPNSFTVLNHLALGDSGMNESLCEKVLAYQEKRRRRFKAWRSRGGVIVMMRSRRPRSSILMKRLARVESHSKPQNPIERKVRTLKKLIPSSENMSLDGLFLHTADYILSLEMRVKVMQILVKALTGCDD